MLFTKSLYEKQIDKLIILRIIYNLFIFYYPTKIYLSKYSNNIYFHLDLKYLSANI